MDYSGADWGTVRTDGVVELNAHYMLQADDGALIYIRNQGYVYGATPAQAGAAPRQAISAARRISVRPRARTTG